MYNPRFFSDVCGRNRWAHLGYEWPLDQQNNVINNAKQNICDVKTNAGTSATERIVVHIDVCWRSAGGRSLPEAFPKTVDSFEKLSISSEV